MYMKLQGGPFGKIPMIYMDRKLQGGNSMEEGDRLENSRENCIGKDNI
jgi:hypothetical protein